MISNHKYYIASSRLQLTIYILFAFIVNKQSVYASNYYGFNSLWIEEKFSEGIQISDSINPLFRYHKIDHKNYIELPESTLGKKILILPRLSAIPNKFDYNGAGTYLDNQNGTHIIRFQRRDSLILMRLITNPSIPSDLNPNIQLAVNNNHYNPIVYVFKIERFKNKKNSYLIHIDDFFNSSIPFINVTSNVSGLDASKSFITSVRVYEENCEVRQVRTYRVSNKKHSSGNSNLSFEINYSFALLPEIKMDKRLADWRINYNSISVPNYNFEEFGTSEIRYIQKWRLEPSDWEKFLKGNKVLPVKPITFYIDRATPEFLLPFIKKGVEDWNMAFEKIGYKNAIIAKRAPTEQEDPDWDINNFQHSVIRFIPNSVIAIGLTVIDPRSGEILKADIQYGANHFDYYKRDLFVQNAAVYPEVRNLKTNHKEIWGHYVRAVISHEVGHTLGLYHNLKASSAYPTDSLRSKSFTKSHGNSPSIMDYAWGNYIAQPEDGVEDFYAKIGENDFWAIKYGYDPIVETLSKKEQKKLLDRWLKEKVDNPLYRPVGGFMNGNDIGDDPVKGAILGIKNLKIIAKNLMEWTTEVEDYQELSLIHDKLYGQFFVCLEPLIKAIGGQYYQFKTLDENSGFNNFIPVSLKEKAIDIINKEVFETPIWLLDLEVQKRIISGFRTKGSINKLKDFQKKVLQHIMMNPQVVMEDMAFNKDHAFALDYLYKGLIKNIFKELKNNESIDIYRRNLQKIFVDMLIQKLDENDEVYKYTDDISVVHANLVFLKNMIEKGARKQKDEYSKYHLEYLQVKINNALEI